MPGSKDAGERQVGNGGLPPPSPTLWSYLFHIILFNLQDCSIMVQLHLHLAFRQEAAFLWPQLAACEWHRVLSTAVLAASQGHLSWAGVRLMCCRKVRGVSHPHGTGLTPLTQGEAIPVHQPHLLSFIPGLLSCYLLLCLGLWDSGT